MASLSIHRTFAKSRAGRLSQTKRAPMSRLESLIVEYLDWQAYLVRRNTKVDRLKQAAGKWNSTLSVTTHIPAIS